MEDNATFSEKIKPYWKKYDMEGTEQTVVAVRYSPGLMVIHGSSPAFKCIQGLKKLWGRERGQGRG